MCTTTLGLRGTRNGTQDVTYAKQALCLLSYTLFSSPPLLILCFPIFLVADFTCVGHYAPPTHSVSHHVRRISQSSFHINLRTEWRALPLSLESCFVLSRAFGETLRAQPWFLQQVIFADPVRPKNRWRPHA